ncbi:iron chelate uptake ABC transporter family permease subunit [Tateyamaria omphalii]|uniref:iron chelate uptake ABC transporter family permease subunit n=1 Tax=Tateyamaria omphalii TaxID=299262 RepID=UPI0021BD094C|nr:iron chelate uptake ABC transporter family permease subunit [Tateyamaria omphalii]
MTVGAKGAWSFVLPFRGGKLAGLLLVALAISTSTVLFQTVSGNRILTPSIVGFDALYGLILTGLVFFLGAQTTISLPPIAVFGLNTGLLMSGAVLLFGTLIVQTRGDLLRMILTGIIFATLFRALTAFWQRMIDPNEFQVIQGASYARFNRIETDLLPLAALLSFGVLAMAWHKRRQWDVLALGHDAATNLGVRVRRETVLALLLIAALVSVSTALVGPVAFLGLLVVSLARLIDPSVTHARLLPIAALVSAITLVGGQLVMERVFALSTPLSVVVDLLGGLLFFFLLLKGRFR